MTDHTIIRPHIVKPLAALVKFMDSYVEHLTDHLPKSVALGVDHGGISATSAAHKLDCAKTILGHLIEAELDEIVTKEMILQKARRAARDSHNMNPSAARDTWLEEFDRLERAASAPHPHHGTASAQRIDARQAGCNA